MKLLRKSTPISFVLLVAWLSMAFSYSTTIECFCCSHNDYQRGSSKRRCVDQLCLTHKNHQEDTHYQQKDNNYHREDKNHHQDDSNCSCCIKCGNPSSDEMVLKIYWMGIDKQQVLALGPVNFERQIFLPEDIFTYLERKPNTKFLSLFLLNSSFLL
jgi:hypothetical protein